MAPLFLPHIFNFMVRLDMYAGAHHEVQFPFEHGTPDGYEFSFVWALPNANARYLKDKIAFWNEAMRHGTYRRVLAVAKTCGRISGTSGPPS